MDGAPPLIQLDALGPSGAYRAFARVTIADVAGRPLAELSKVPRLFVQRALAALAKATTLEPDARFAALARAGERFATGRIDGRSIDDHERVVARVSGVPLATVREATRVIATHATRAREIIAHACPHGAVPWERAAYDVPRTAMWTRRGDVFAVLAAGNHPALHSLWLEALALGYRVAIRPSQGEPFTPHRLVLALREAGFGNDQVVLLPTDHEVAEAIIDGADLATVYGGDDVVNRYRHHPKVRAHGPGRAKIVITAEVDFTRHLDTIVDSISAGAGVSCRNATAVFVEGDPAPVARAIAERLAALPVLPPDDERAALPAVATATGRKLEQLVLERAAGATVWAGRDGIATELAGAAVLRPAIIELARADAPEARLELPFPCAWVAPWSRADGVRALAGSLVVTAITTDDGLVRELLHEPSIGNVYVGDRATHLMDPCLPAEGYLGDFLMCSKAFERG